MAKTTTTIVTDRDGNYILAGDTVTDFRGNPGVFHCVTRDASYNGTAKVLVDGREFYDRVWGLTVTVVSA